MSLFSNYSTSLKRNLDYVFIRIYTTITLICINKTETDPISSSGHVHIIIIRTDLCQSWIKNNRMNGTNTLSTV